MNNLTNNYILEHDNRLTLPENTIETFNYDMKNGHLRGKVIGGGNFIKISRIPARIKTYWNSVNKREGAHLLDESNRGMRVLRQNSNGTMQIFQNFYIWTEGELDGIEDMSDEQRILQIEVSGVGAEITPLIANPSSDIFVDKVEAISKIQAVENFGGAGGDEKVPAGALMSKIANDLYISKETNKSSLEKLSEIDAAVRENNDTNITMSETLLEVSSNQKGQENKLDAFFSERREQDKRGNAFYDSATSILRDLSVTENESKAFLEKIKDANEANKISTQNIAANITNINLRQEEELQTLRAFKEQSIQTQEKIDAFRGENREKLEQIRASIETNLPTFRDENHVGLLEVKQEIIDLHETASNLALETSIQELLEKMRTISIQLDTQNALLQGLSLGTGNMRYMPADFEIDIRGANSNNYTGIEFLVSDGNNNEKNGCELTSQNLKNYNQKWFYNIHTQPLYVPTAQPTTTTDVQNSILYHFGLTSNYQIRFKLQYSVRYRVFASVGNLDKDKFLKQFQDIFRALPNLQIYNSEGDIALMPVSKNYNIPASASYDTINSANLRYVMTYGETAEMETSRYEEDITFVRANNGYVGIPSQMVQIPNAGGAIPSATIVEEYANFILRITGIGERRVSYSGVVQKKNTGLEGL